VNDALLGNEELMNHAKEIAKYHSVSKQKKGYNYVYSRLGSNYKIITEVYKALNKYGRMNLPLCPASEWLLDNFYIIEEQYKEIQKNMDNKFYKKLYAINNGQFKNCPRTQWLWATRKRWKRYRNCWKCWKRTTMFRMYTITRSFRKKKKRSNTQ
jgi:cyclic beta-1,2-glucan synthetase